MASAELAQKLLQIKAIKLSPSEPFTWASGIKSPIYCDNRLLLSYPSIRNKVTDAFVGLSRQFAPFDCIAGVATAGIAHGALLAQTTKQPFIYVRSKAKGHGRQNLIEGELRPHAKVLVVEDLISTGGSAIQAVEALRAEGAEVVGVIAIFSYGFDQATAAFEAANCKFDTLCNYEALVEEAHQSKYIQEDDKETLTAWRRNPMNWSPN